jgi:ABC-type transport system involved in cytochrome bd biosynthesis fused ATPase/permease subunit
MRQTSDPETLVIHQKIDAGQQPKNFSNITTTAEAFNYIKSLHIYYEIFCTSQSFKCVTGVLIVTVTVVAMVVVVMMVIVIIIIIIREGNNNNNNNNNRT